MRYLGIALLVLSLSGCSTWDKVMDTAKGVIEIAPAILDDVKAAGERAMDVFKKKDGEPMPEPEPKPTE